jgi:transposase
MKRRSQFELMIDALAARNCFDAGACVADIAKQAKVSVSTIRRWLAVTGLKGKS